MKSTTSKTTESKRDEIQKYIGYVSDDKIDLLYDIATLGRYPNKSDLMRIAGVENTGKIDTAFPVDYYNRIHEIFPNISQGNLVYDYREGHGQLVNVNDLIVSRIVKLK